MEIPKLQKWYERDELPRKELELLIKKGNYREMHELMPGLNQSKFIKINDKIAILINNGLVGYYTITRLADRSGTHAVGRDEAGIDGKGEEFCLDSSMCGCYSVGYKVLEKFPWEQLSNESAVSK